MADAFRKLLVPVLLALTSFALPSAAAVAVTPVEAAPAVGTMCLANDYPRSRIVNVESCNTSSSSQRWTIVGELISSTVNPGMCLANDYPRSRIVNVESCNSSSSSQRWTIFGEAISSTVNPGMCLSSDYPRTRIVNVESCNPSGIRQHWTVQGEQISMTLV
ncbi:RICIN domain-containing protein [Streptomyces sp. GMY02]|uniref:ricin-type beta-trefoil lectin domain protein n=1 Tax=Streptomyces sp. GMY02 TaxID=1333528 RepID=UPI001C2C9B6F|nr:ricin-type beta-trefoil lectin domain protein [Streptomyces sp. GMY02]QXE37178.1 RICIN domain-containing protein [Streptomyces sp. GMY02]